MGIGTMIEIHHQWIFNPVLITSILWDDQYTCNIRGQNAYMVFLLIKHKGRNSPSGIGVVTSLTVNSNGSTAPAVLILGARNGASGHWHDEVSGRRQVGITEVVDGGNDQPIVFFISLPG